MKKYVEVAATKEFANSFLADPILKMAVNAVLENAPAADVAEVVHSFWDDSGRYVFPSGRKAVCCDICKCALGVGEYNRFNWNYCPVCGAKMDGERKDK